MDPRFNIYPQWQTQQPQPQPQPQPQVTQRQHQRFSWQAPLETDVAPTTQSSQQYQEVHHQPQQPAINIDAVSQNNRGFSSTPNPINHGHAFYVSTSDDSAPPSSPVFTPIDDRPQSTFNMLNAPARRQSKQAYETLSHPHDEDALVSPSSPEAQTLPFMLVESVVGQEEPISSPQQPELIPQSPVQQSRHARQMSNLAPINTTFTQSTMPAIPQSPHSGGEHQTSPGALPYKTPISPISAAPIRRDTPNSSYNSHMRYQRQPHEPYSPHDFSTHSLTTPHAIFSPDAAHGPNGLDFSLHQPGQIRHPNMDDNTNREWKTGLCSCTPDLSTCFTGLFCPCILNGRTAYRLSQKSRKSDPTDMLGYSNTNGHCIAMTLACGVGMGWVFPMLQRTRIRHVYKLQGSCGDDLLKGCCCCCCVAVQNEREVRGREESANRWAGPASKDVYTRNAGMEYRAQN